MSAAEQINTDPTTGFQQPSVEWVRFLRLVGEVEDSDLFDQAELEGGNEESEASELDPDS